MKTRLAAVAAAAALGGALTGYLLSPSAGGAAARPAAAPVVYRRGTLHVALNMPAEDRAKAAALGYDLFDTGPDEGDIASLPKGGRALVWAGNTTCGPFEPDGISEFTDLVKRFGDDDRVYGWYLSDEPNPDECPDVVGKIRERADVVHRYAPRQKAFASLTDWPMEALKPSATRLDLVGLDPYPCRTGGGRCDLNAIDTMLRQARRAQIPSRMIVPVFQTFGQSCTTGDHNWRLPGAGEMRSMLARWDRFVPRPAFDISYSWGRQDEWACPSLSDADGRSGTPDLHAVMKRHNTRPTGPGLPPHRPEPGRSAKPESSPSAPPPSGCPKTP